ILAIPRTEPERAEPADATAPVGSRRTVPRVLWFVGWLGLAALAAAVLGLGGYRWSRAELQRVEREIKDGHLGAARSHLARLSALGLGGVEADYWRGACEEAEGQVDAALATYATIPPGSSRYANAALRRAHLAWEHGRYAEVEQALEPAEFPRTSLAFALRERDLQHVYYFTGRSDDLRRRKHEEWLVATNKAEVLRKHWE